MKGVLGWIAQGKKNYHKSQGFSIRKKEIHRPFLHCKPLSSMRSIKQKVIVHILGVISREFSELDFGVVVDLGYAVE